MSITIETVELGVNQYGNKIVSTTYHGTHGEGGPIIHALTRCCEASDKGTEYGIVCRGCYSPIDLEAQYDLEVVA